MNKRIGSYTSELPVYHVSSSWICGLTENLIKFVLKHLSDKLLVPILCYSLQIGMSLQELTKCDLLSSSMWHIFQLIIYEIQNSLSLL